MAEQANSHSHVLIMSGGSGTRFWPKSRSLKPKQLLALWDDKSLIEHTVLRFSDSIPAANRWIVTTQSLVDPTKEILQKAGLTVQYLGEPQAKNTAACILWGVLEIAKTDPEAVIAVMPADHYIGDEAAFREAVNLGMDWARSNKSIVTLGVKPNRPETGYGYIEVDSLQSKSVCKVKKFVEKPDLRTAVKYLESGRYLWNAGMFLLSVETALNAFSKTMPALYLNLSEGMKAGKSISDIYFAIQKSDSVSVDYGVMEPAISSGIDVSVIPVDCGWNDVGSFTALEDIEFSVLGQVASLNEN